MGGWARFRPSGARGVLMDEFSELEARIDAFCIKTRAFLDQLGDLAPAQHQLGESLAEIRKDFESLRRLEQANGQTKEIQRGASQIRAAFSSAVF